jgi:hypothetical protein
MVTNKIGELQQLTVAMNVLEDVLHMSEVLYLNQLD